MEINGENNYFFTLRDHKDNLTNNPQVRLINPAKSELGEKSKVILDKTNLSITENFSLNQWKDIQNVLDWSKEIPDKKLHKSVVFNIKGFYLLLKELSLNKPLYFAETSIDVSNDDKKIKYERKSLFNNQQTWMMKDSGLFNVTMGAFDKAEVCIFALFLIMKL